jgi:hypothetical protein
MWSIDEAARNAIDKIIRESVMDPVGTEFMALPARKLTERA